MKLDPITRARVHLTRRLALAILREPHTRELLSRHRRRLFPPLEETTAAMLRLEDLEPHGVAGSPIEKARKDMRSGVAIAALAPRASVDVQEASIDGIGLRTYAPPSIKGRAPALVWLHGGGWATGDLDTHDSLCRWLALEGDVRVLSVDYRLAPEHPFPAPLEDALTAFRGIAREHERFGVDPTAIAIGGDSAGANLSAVVSLETRGERFTPALQVLLYGAFDATCSEPSHRKFARGLYLTEDAIAWYIDHYTAKRDALRRDPRVSPMFTEDLSGAPLALMVTAELDPLVDEGARYCERLVRAGVRVEYQCARGLIHGYALMTGLVPRALEETCAMARSIGQTLRRPERA